MTKMIIFINEEPSEMRKLLKRISRFRLEDECNKRGLPFPTNTNKFSVLVSRGRLDLCYQYFDKSSTIMNLDPLELPHIGWRLYIK